MSVPRVLITVTTLCLLFSVALPPITNAAGMLGAPQPPSVAPRFGSAPRNCPVATATVIHHVRGTTPVIWVGSGALRGNSGWYIANDRLALGFGDRTRYGYPQKIFWQLLGGAHGPVTLRGWNLRTRQRIWFGRPLPQANRTIAPPPVIAWPSAIVRHRQAPTLTFVPAAGCYVLQAAWRGGRWTIPFTAGG